jgi:hypothetical protein
MAAKVWSPNYLLFAERSQNLDAALSAVAFEEENL